MSFVRDGGKSDRCSLDHFNAKGGVRNNNGEIPAGVAGVNMGRESSVRKGTSGLREENLDQPAAIVLPESMIP
jgi:hypothetical protein